MGEPDQRLGLVYPDDGEEAPADGKTKSTPADLDALQTDWGDALQAIIWVLNRHGGNVGDVADRPAAGSGAPRWWLSVGATDGAPTLYFNDEGAGVWAAISAGDADTLDGLDSTQFLRSDADDTWKGSTFTFEGPDDGSGLVSLVPGADTATAGTPSIAANLPAFEGGVAGAGNTISTIWGDAGEWEPIAVTGSGTAGNSTTSTTYTAQLGAAGQGVVAGDHPKQTNMVDYGVSGVFSLRNDTTGETTTARLADDDAGVALTTTEVAVTDTVATAVHTPIEPYDPGVPWKFEVELKVTAGTGYLETNPAAILWGRA